MQPSKTRINRAGDLLRRFWLGQRLADPEVAEALDLVASCRQTHAYPLTLVTVGLRQFVESEAETVVVGQRLKRMDRILQKLVRFPRMKLARMQDIGGCRAVLADAREVDAVAARIRRNWRVAREGDHRDAPEATTGYRAVHLIVEREAPEDDEPRLIEVQLRTRGQHLWAEEVERVAAQTGFGLKDGKGPDDLLEFFRTAADLIALTETEGPAAEDVIERYERYRTLRTAVSRYLGPSS